MSYLYFTAIFRVQNPGVTTRAKHARTRRLRNKLHVAKRTSPNNGDHISGPFATFYSQAGRQQLSRTALVAHKINISTAKKTYIKNHELPSGLILKLLIAGRESNQAPEFEPRVLLSPDYFLSQSPGFKPSFELSQS